MRPGPSSGRRRPPALRPRAAWARRAPGPWSSRGGSRGLAFRGLLGLGLVLGRALDQQLLRLEVVAVVLADRHHAHGLVEVAGDDAAVLDRHHVAVLVAQVE